MSAVVFYLCSYVGREAVLAKVEDPQVSSRYSYGLWLCGGALSSILFSKKKFIHVEHVI